MSGQDTEYRIVICGFKFWEVNESVIDASDESVRRVFRCKMGSVVACLIYPMFRDTIYVKKHEDRQCT